MDEDSNRRLAARSVLAAASGDATQIVFIDGSIAGAQALADGVRSGVVAVILDPDLDGVRQIADYLAAHDIHAAAAIDIVAHGADGIIRIGSTLLSAATIDLYLPQLAQIGDALRPGGDILLYGCDVAQDAAGEAFLQQLSQATGGADIAASSHVIGAASAGGDWNLDVDTGTIDVAVPFTEQALDAFSDALPVAVNQLYAAFFATLGSSLTGLEKMGVSGTSLVGSVTNIRNGTETANFSLLGGVAVDAPLGKYFMVNSDNSTVNQIVTGSIAGGAPTVLYSAPTPLASYAISGLDIDQPNHTLYFSMNAANAAQKGIYKIDESGGAATAVVVGQGIRSPDFLSIDSNDGLVFFVDCLVSSSVNNLDVGNLGNGTVTVLNSQLSAIQAQLAVNVTAGNSAGLLFDVEVDGVNNVLYFTATNGANLQHNYIFKVPYTVSAGAVTLGSVTTLYSGTAAGQPGDIVIDTAGGVFYVGNFANQSIYSGSLNGGGSLTLVHQHSASTGVQPRGLFFESTPTVAASGSVTFGQGGSPVVLASGLTVANPNGQNLASATVTVAGGTAANGETLAANTVGTNITAIYTSANETLTLTGNDTLANYQAVLRSVTFTSTGATAGARTINWTVSDGIISSTTPTSSVTVLTNATAPTFTSAASASEVENTAASSVVYTAVATDPDVIGTVSYSLTGTDAAKFSIEAATGKVRFLAAPNFEAPTDANADNAYQVIVHANDGIHDTTKNVSISVTNIDDTAPTISTSATVSFTEQGSAAVLASGLTLSDPDSTTLAGATVSISGGFVTGDTLNFTSQNGISGSYNSSTGALTLTGSASVANYQTALRSITFSSSSDNPTNSGVNTSRTISWTANDGTLGSTAATSTVNVTAVNDIPVATAGATVSYTEQGTAAVLDSGLVLVDVDNLTLASATVSISGFVAGDTLNFTNQSGISGSYDSSTGVLTLSGSASLVNYQAALRSITFSSSSDNPTNSGASTSRTITWTANDGTANSTSVTSTVNVTAINDAPVVTAGATVSFTEQGSAAVLNSGLTLSDPDSTTLAGAAVSISGFVAGDTLNFTSQNGITGSYDSGTGVLTLTGSASVANYQAALRSISFSSSSDNPTNSGVSTSRTITWTASDGTANSTSVTSTVNVTAVNDIPVATAGATVSYTEQGTAAVLDSGLVLVDVDNLTLASATVSISGFLTGDTLNFTNQNGISASYDSSTGVLTLSGSASLANYQAALRSITFSSTSDNPTNSGANTSRTITWTANDGTANSTSVTSTVNVTAVNDAPVVTAGATTATTLSFVATDPDGGSLSLTSPFDAAFGTPVVTNGATTTLTPAAQAAALAGTLKVSDGTNVVDVVGLYLGTGGNDIGTAPNAGLSNALYGFGGNDRLYGAAGNDTLLGGDGNDQLDGHAGADEMSGGVGNDIYYVDNAGDTVTESPGEGIDTIRTTLSSYTLGAEIDRVMFTGLGNFVGTGNGLANVLTGGAGNDALNGGDGNDKLVGGTGADAMTGGIGNDVYYVDNLGDAVTEAVGGGIDTVRTTLSTYTLGADVERLTYIGSGNFVGIGNELANILTGGAGNDTLSGGAGDDVLNGGTGADGMTGGADNDFYYVDDAGDTVTEIVGGGIDTVRTTLSTYTLTSEVERLQFTGAGAFAGSGNELANRITGGAGNDTLSGGAGDDVLNGGTGADGMTGGADNDFYYVDDAGDTVTEIAGGGIDTVRTTLSTYTLTSEVERLQFSGSGAFVGTGNGIANRITGGAGDDTLNGGLGNDRLTGGDGSDSFVFSTALNTRTNLDSIVDFDVAGDSIELSLTIFTALSSGPLSAAAFFIGAAAHDADDRIIYNDVTGRLSYDADGSGAGAATQFASLAPGLALTHDHLFII